MNVGACVGLKETLAANRLGSNSNDRYPLNPYIGKSFFDGENYRAALERLDGGYAIAMDLIEFMQDYLDNEREQARNLISYADKWTTRLKQQSTLSSYHTTKRAQLDVVGITKELARVKESTCKEIQQVIEKYRQHVDETYVSERFRPGRKHRRTGELKKLFKAAHSSLHEVSDELDTLRSQMKKAQDALRAAQSACEILELDPTTTDKQLARANDTKTKKETLLNDIEEKLRETKDRYKSAQKVYRSKATDIFKQCQYAEEERLEQIRETLLDFVHAMYTEKSASDLNDVFKNLSTKVTRQQNSFDDLLFWANTYGIDNKLAKSLMVTTNDNDDENGDDEQERIVETRPTKKSTGRETDKSDKHQTSVDNQADDEERTAITGGSSTPASTKTKLKRTKTTTEKKHTHTTEPSTTNHSILNHV